MSDIALLMQSVRRVRGKHSAADVHPLSNDAENRIWYIVQDGERFLAKLPNGRWGLTIPATLEAELMQLAAEAGVAPALLGHDQETNILFFEELRGCRVVARHAVESAETLTAVGTTLQRLHGLAPPGRLREFEPVVFAEQYVELVSMSKRGAAQELRDECVKLAALTAHLLPGESVCHNDLHRGNVLRGNGTWLIDFEYAAKASPVVDVASYVAFNELGDDAARQLARECLEEQPSLVELRAVAKIHRVLGELWELARSDNNACSGGAS